MNVRTVRIIGGAGVLWNLVGVANYLAHVGLLGAAPEGGAMPAAITAAFAVAVWSGLAGSIGLVLLQRWAAPLLWLSFIGSVVNWSWVLGYSAAASVPLGVAVIAVALALALVATRLPKGAAGRARGG